MEKFLDWYLWYYIFLALMGFIYVQQKNSFLATDEGKKLGSFNDYRVRFIFALLVFLPIFFIAGFRDKWFVDTGTYVYGFEQLPNDLAEWKYEDDTRGPGFRFFCIFIRQYITQDYRTWLIIIAAISTLCLVSFYKKYTSEVVLCAFLFFASTDFHSWMMNGIRQFLAVSIFIVAIPLLFRKKFILFLAIGLLLYTFHTSAIIALPIYFLALGKPMNKKTFMVLGLALLAVVFLNQFTNAFVDIVSTTTYRNSVKEMISDLDDGTNVLRVLVYSIPALLAIFYRNKIPEKVSPIISFSINMSLMTMAFYFVSMFTSGIFFGRMPIFFSLFNYILLPWEIKTFFEESNGRVIYAVMVLLYLVFYIIQMVNWGI